MLKLLSTVLVAVLLVGWGEFSPAATAAEKGIAEPAASSTKEISDTAKNKSKFEVENDEDEYDGLPKGKGRDEVQSYCSVCHSLAIVKQQGLNRASWKEALEWMVEEQEMDKLDQDDNKLVLDYLVKFFGRDLSKKRK